MKNMKKVFSVVLTIAMMATMMSTALAAPVPGISDPGLPEGATGLASKILGVIQWVGYGFAIGMLIYIGIKYMMSAANEKADLKKGLINYVIGAALVVAAATVFGAIKTWMGSASEG